MDESAVKLIETALPRMRDRWLGGGDASQVAPPTWEGAPIRLLALAGHALQVLRTPALPADLTLRPPLPELALPVLNDERRTLLRRALSSAKSSQEGETAIIRLLVARGFVAHPDDWRPLLPQLQEVEAYAPWAAWREGARARSKDETPTASTWRDWSWTERRNAFVHLRETTPAAARTLLEAILPFEPAEKRLVLVGALASGLSSEDQLLLEGLATDRSEKVKQIARRMLTRLGRFAGPGETDAELAGFFDLHKTGILRRASAVRLKPLKTPAQRQRLFELLDLTTLPALAASLGLSEPDLVQAWEPSQHTPDAALVSLAFLTGSPAAVEAMVTRVEGDFPLTVQTVTTLAELAPAEHCERLFAAGVSREAEPGFWISSTLAGRNPGRLSRRGLEQSPAWKALVALCTATGEDGERQRNLHLARGLSALGVICSASAAQWVIDTLTGLGLSHADPVLNYLTLNAALSERPSA